jgi:hypothetical protein
MSRSARLSALLFTFVLVRPFDVSAQELLGKKADTPVFTTFATLANVAGLFTAVGSGIGTACELPNQNWAIAGTVSGSAQLTFGALSLASGLADYRNVWLAVYGAATLLMGAGNLILGLINLIKANDVFRQIELLEGPWSLTPIDVGGDGVGVALTIR